MPPVALLGLALLCSAACVEGGKILVVPVDGSHWINMKVLIEELHSRGHSLSVLRPAVSRYIAAESPLYHTININCSSGFDDIGSHATRLIPPPRTDASFWAHVSILHEAVVQVLRLHKVDAEMIEQMFEDGKLMQRLRDEGYDLVLTDPVIGSGVLLARRLGLPLVLNVRWTFQGEGHMVIAPSPLSYVPSTGAELTDKMSFTQRVKNVFICLVNRLFYYMIYPPYQPLVHHYFGSDVHLTELIQSADIWLMRTDFTFEFPRPTMPNVVYIAGFQCKPSRPLPPDLEAFVQSSGEHGVIVMTLGALVGELSEDLAEEIAAAFAQLPQKVLWRHTGQRPATVANNTLLLDWLPQNDLLGHPKTRLFVAHGGTNGIQEAVHHGVPLLGLPLMFDQPDNLSRMKVRGVAKVLDVATLNRENFLETLKELLTDPSYREKMKLLSALHRDQPIQPLDRAVFWIEFVMRHKGAPHLRTESYKMSAIQYYCVDVAVFLLAVMLLAVTLLVSTLRLLWRRVFCRSKVKKE